MAAPRARESAAAAADLMTLDHQQRWFTGWGDDPHAPHAAGLKTPSLGLVWTTQIACRVALIKKPVYGRQALVGGSNIGEDGDGDESGEKALSRWRRWMKVVFAPYVGPSGMGTLGAVEFEIGAGGIRAVGGNEVLDAAS